MKIQLDPIKIIINKIKKKILKNTIITLIVIVLIIVFLSGLDLANKNKLVRGLKIAGIPVGNLSLEKAQAKINSAVEDFFKKDIILRYSGGNKNEIWTGLPSELGIKINTDLTLAKASGLGHQRASFIGVYQQIMAFLGYYNLPLNYSVNEKQLESFIGEKLNSIDKPAVNASFVYSKEKNDFVLIPSQEGTIIDRENLKMQLYEKTRKLTKDEISLTLINDRPEILENETKEAYIRAKEILKRVPCRLIINDPLKIAPAEFILTKDELISVLEFKPVSDKINPENKVLGINLNKQALTNYLNNIALKINREPVNAQLTIAGDRVTNFSLSKDGLKLEIEKNIGKIREEIVNKNTPVGEIKLEISITHPKIVTRNVDNLGLTSLIGRGVSNFSGSPKNRIHNIGVGAAKFNGVLIKPGEEFSFNTVLGDVGPETGYKAELVIKQNKTIPEYGGGLCQVSTTMFRAAVYAGLPIKERQAHAFPVKYYNPQGFDATIYPPHPDLRFVNDTPAYILIQTKINGNELVFEFYGTSDGRKVEIEGPYQYDIKENGSMKAQLIRRIYDKDGNFIIESIFNSNYNSPALYPVERNPLE